MMVNLRSLSLPPRTHQRVAVVVEVVEAVATQVVSPPLPVFQARAYQLEAVNLSVVVMAMMAVNQS